MTRANQPNNGEPIIIKKYANRRLYNTGSSTYVTLDDLAEMVKNGEEFVVQDAKSGDDITRSVLGQIIFDQEAREGQNLLSINFLRQLIKFYGDSMQTMVPSYLEYTMNSFTREQDKLRDQMKTMFGEHSVAGLEQMEQITRRNMEMFQKAFAMFVPFAGGAGMNPDSNGDEAAPKDGERSAQSETDQDIQELKNELAALKSKLDKFG